MAWIEKGKPLWLLMLVLIISSNFLLYKTTIGEFFLSEDAQLIALGSIIDLFIFLPLFIMLYRKNFTFKSFIIVLGLGGVLVRFLIPNSLLGTYQAIAWISFGIGVAVEGIIVLVELLLIVSLVRYMPKIFRKVKGSDLPTLFSFPQAVYQYVQNHFLIRAICSEFLMFYYAFGSWKKKPYLGITMHKNSSFIAFQIMLIHAIIVETIGVHYWLHGKAPILSIIFLIFNIYSVIFFLADLQALRLHPIHFDSASFYISLGLMKRAKIDYANIETIIEDPALLHHKLSKDTIDFIIRDFEKVYPDFILKMKTPQKVTVFMGMEKVYQYIAIKCDSPEELKVYIKNNSSLFLNPCKNE